MAKIKKYLACYDITIECDVPEAENTIELKENEDGTIESISREIEEESVALEEADETLQYLSEQHEENKELLEEKPESITEEIVTEANNNFLLALGRLGLGTQDIKNLSIGQESTRTPYHNLMVTQEGIVDSIKNFFKKIWEWIKGLFRKIGELLGLRKKKSESMENSTVEALGNSNEELEANIEKAFRDSLKNPLADRPGSILAPFIMANLGKNGIIKITGRIPGDFSGPVTGFFKILKDKVTGETSINGTEFMEMKPFRNMDGIKEEEKIAKMFGIKLENDDRLLYIDESKVKILTRDEGGFPYIETLDSAETLNKIEEGIRKSSSMADYNYFVDVYEFWRDESAKATFSNHLDKLAQQQEKFVNIFSGEMKDLEKRILETEDLSILQKARFKTLNIYLTCYKLLGDQILYLQKGALKALRS